jgi:N-acetylglucosaminyldiphosphoundecaprenol N-acetyl-beta-D-mannosaminyltransferase
MSTSPVIKWPKKHDLFGVQVSATTYEECVNVITEAAKSSTPAVVSLHAAHAVVTASDDDELCEAVNKFQIVAPDGQPVRWALNKLYRTKLRDRVYGPELMLRLCRRAAEEGVSVYLYGGVNDELLDKLRWNLTAKFPQLRIAGAESPPFRPLSEEEDERVVRRINESGAGLVFIGLGCPKQDHFAFEHREKLNGVQICVGAAFGFHAGVKKIAPAWMQRRGLEWLYRLLSEPRRLFRRYLVTNSIFVKKFLRQWCGQLFRKSNRRPTNEAASSVNN